MEAILFLGGLIIGVCLMFVIRKPPRSSGTFVIDFSDPLKDVCRLELGEDLNDIYRKKRIVLDIITYNENSHN